MPCFLLTARQLFSLFCNFGSFPFLRNAEINPQNFQHSTYNYTLKKQIVDITSCLPNCKIPQLNLQQLKESTELSEDAMTISHIGNGASLQRNWPEKEILGHVKREVASLAD